MSLDDDMTACKKFAVLRKETEINAYRCGIGILVCSYAEKYAGDSEQTEQDS